MVDNEIDDLEPSILGTKEYWDNNYADELANYASNPNDEGTVWFSDSSAEEKVLEFLEQLYPGNGIHDEIDTARKFRILDLGTGNGHFLFELRDHGWASADMVGVDYSGRSVELANQIQSFRRKVTSKKETFAEIRFEKWDMLKDDPGDWVGPGFDLVLDKGTFDAISLSNEQGFDGKRPNLIYAPRLCTLLKPGGLFVITSCNWTELELRKLFESNNMMFIDRIKYPSFSFGGKTGQTLSTVCFQYIYQSSLS